MAEDATLTKTNGVRPDDGVVDLDDLVKPTRIKLRGQVFDLPPMGLDTLAKFDEARRELQRLGDADTGGSDDERFPELQRAIAELDKIFPEVGGFGTLAIPQLVRIFEVIGQMAAGTVGNLPSPAPNRQTRRGQARGAKGKR